MLDPGSPNMCPVVRKLITLVVRMSQLSGLQERGQLIDQLTDLEAEGIARNVPRRTVEMIRAARLQLRVEGLMPGTSHPRGH